jgi:hypothetical protein
MHFGPSVLVTLLTVLLLFVAALGGHRRPVYMAAILGIVGVAGLPLKGEDGINIALCWLLLLAALGAVVIVRRVHSQAVAASAKTALPEPIPSAGSNPGRASQSRDARPVKRGAPARRFSPSARPERTA